MNNINLSSEIVRLIEAGVNKQLNKSILYYPFRLFFNLFKKSNLQMVNNVKNRMADDIEHNFNKIDNFDKIIFIDNNKISAVGDKLMIKSYNIGIRLIKKDLTVGIAFRAFRDVELRQRIYNYILDRVQNSVKRILNGNF